MKYLKYLKYVICHKWYVMIECFKSGLFLRGILHDWHKLLPSEFFPYANFFYEKKRRDSTGYYKPTDTGDDKFDFAWLLHQKRADHHWQWWILPEDCGGVKILPMSDIAIREMLCDWCGASKAQGHGGWHGDSGVLSWYLKNGGKMQLHPDTRAKVDYMLVNSSRSVVNMGDGNGQR